MPPLKGIRFLRTGLLLGELKKKRFEPSQAFAMNLKKEEYEHIIALPASDERIIKYLKGETLEMCIRDRLKTLEGMDTRPTTDRIKETLFNIISPSIFDSIFLDLFSGSGGIGIEALSRGAREAVFVENNPKAMACIKENLKFTRLEAKAATMTTDVMDALYRLEGEKVFDFIFMDPPYDRGLEMCIRDRFSIFIHFETNI